MLRYDIQTYCFIAALINFQGTEARLYGFMEISKIFLLFFFLGLALYYPYFLLIELCLSNINININIIVLLQFLCKHHSFMAIFLLFILSMSSKSCFLCCLFVSLYINSELTVLQIFSSSNELGKSLSPWSVPVEIDNLTFL